MGFRGTHPLSVSIILYIISVSWASDNSSPQKMAALEARVNEIRTKDNVSQRKEVNDIFLLADMYASQKNSTKACELYEEALRVDSFRFDYQLKLATLLKNSDNAKRAIDKFKSVYTYAEDENTVNTARNELLSSKVSCPSPSQKMGRFTITVMPFGHINIVLVDEILSELNQITNIRYTLSKREFSLGKLDRTYGQLHLSKICANIRNEHPEAEIPSDNEPNLQLNFLIKSLQAEHYSPEKIANFDAMLHKEFQVGQRDASRLLSDLKAQFGNNTDPNVSGFLGITEADIYSGDNNFLFGWGQPGFAVMSYCRFKADFNGEPQHRPRLVKRATKQAISGTFFILNIPRCDSPMCARAYPHSLAEHDLKEVQLCDWCNEQLTQQLSHLQE